MRKLHPDTAKDVGDGIRRDGTSRIRTQRQDRCVALFSHPLLAQASAQVYSFSGFQLPPTFTLLIKGSLFKVWAPSSPQYTMRVTPMIGHALLYCHMHPERPCSTAPKLTVESSRHIHPKRASCPTRGIRRAYQRPLAWVGS